MVLTIIISAGRLKDVHRPLPGHSGQVSKLIVSILDLFIIYYVGHSVLLFIAYLPQSMN